MNGARGFPPGLSRVECLLRALTELRADRAGNNECHYAIRMQVRRRTRSGRIVHLYENDLSGRVTRE